MFGRLRSEYRRWVRLSDSLSSLSSQMGQLFADANGRLDEGLERLGATLGSQQERLSASLNSLPSQMGQLFADANGRLDEGLERLGATLGSQQERAAERLALAVEALQSIPSRRPPVVTADGSIRIAFFFQSASIWPSWESVWKACTEHSRVRPILVLATFGYPDRELAQFDEARSMLIDRGIDFVTAEAFRLDEFQPHVVFVQTPYTDSLPSHLQLEAISLSGARLAYIPYGLEIGGGGFNLKYQFNLPVHQTAWRIFARSDRHKRMFAKYCASGCAHVTVTGHPKFDQLARVDEKSVHGAIRAAARGRKIVVWCPHFSVQDPPAWSTFGLYGEGILAAVAERPDLFLLIRPHPLLFDTLRNKGGSSKSDEEAFRSRIAAMDNCELDERDNYLSAFFASDAMMTDAGSFLLEFIPTGKPLLYLAHPDGIGLNDDADIADSVATARELVEVESFLDMLIQGQDPTSDVRRAVVPEFLGNVDGKAGERIRDHVIAELSLENFGGPVLLQSGQKHQDALRYWSNSSHTYLAPSDYYDRQEAALKKLLEPLRLNTALDVGCGDGRFTRLIAEFCTYVKGIDLSPSLIAQARAEADPALNIDFAVKSIEDIKTCGSYNLVACMGVTSGLIDTSSFVRTIDILVAMVRPGGFLLMKNSLSVVEDQILGADCYVARYRSETAYERMFTRRGLKLQSKIELTQLPDRKLVNNLYLLRKA